MKYLPHFFRKGQLTKMFFLFPVGGHMAWKGRDGTGQRWMRG